MPDNATTIENLKRRRDEILSELGHVNDSLRTELDPNTEEQPLQLEQDEVAVTMEGNLRKELNEIEDKLSELGED